MEAQEVTNAASVVDVCKHVEQTNTFGCPLMNLKEKKAAFIKLLGPGYNKTLKISLKLSQGHAVVTVIVP